MLDFTVISHGSIVMFRPDTEAAHNFMADVAVASWQYLGEWICLDHRAAEQFAAVLNIHALTY